MKRETGREDVTSVQASRPSKKQENEKHNSANKMMTHLGNF